jgi:hypothetical protein
MDESDLRGFVQDELVFLWGRLIDAYRAYLGQSWVGKPTLRWDEGNDRWSMGCEGLGDRITAATVLVGPVAWRDIPIPALAEGWFAWANRKLGIPALLPTDEEMTELHRYMAEQTRGLV